MNSKQKKILASIAVALVAVILVVVYFVFGKTQPQETSGDIKNITITVVNSKEESTVYQLETQSEYLRGAMEEAQKDGLTFSGNEDVYGLMLITINGERADYNLDGAYWSIIVNGEYGMNGIDTQPVKDGDEFKLVYTNADEF